MPGSNVRTHHKISDPHSTPTIASPRETSECRKYCGSEMFLPCGFASEKKQQILKQINSSDSAYGCGTIYNIGNTRKQRKNTFYQKEIDQYIPSFDVFINYYEN